MTGRVRIAIGAVLAVAVMVPAAALAAAPSNDDFANATVLDAAGGSVTASNLDATPQSGEPDHAGSTFDAVHSVWFSWTAPASGPATVSTCGSAFNTRLGVYTGGSVDTLTAAVSNEDSTGPGCAGTKFGEATFDASGGTTYSIAVDTSGDLAGDGSGPPQGEIKLTLSGPQPPPTDDGTNPGVATSEAPFSFRMPRLKPDCKGAEDDEDCTSKSKRLKFRTLLSARSVIENLRAEGADLTVVENPKTAGGYDFKDGDVKPGAVLDQSIEPGETVTTTSGAPQTLKLAYHEPTKSKSCGLLPCAFTELLEKLVKDLEERRKKSPCQFIANNAGPDDIERALGQWLGAGTLTESAAARLLKKEGCGYEAKYVDAPGASVDYVKDVTGIDLERDLVKLVVALPVRQDFLITFRDDPTKTDVDKNTPDGDTMGIGTDGALTASAIRSNVLTVQVIERLTGRLVEGVDVRFIGENGKTAVQRTDQFGETTFSARLEHAGSYSVGAEHRDTGGARMQGFREVRVKNRKGEQFTTLSGRTLTWLGRADHYQGTQADIDRARSLPVVPATIGTGLSAEPVSAPRIQQGTVAVPSSNGFIAGQHNVIATPNDSSYAIGAAPGLIAFGGGIDGSFARRAAKAPRFNIVGAIGNFVSGIVTGLSNAFKRGAGTVAQRVSAADQQKIDATAARLAQEGVPAPQSNLISDKGLGVISTGGGNVISTGGGNVIATGGLNLIGDHGTGLIGQAGGNLIGQAGGNLIGQAGGNVISTGGGNLVPVYGGRIISDNGASK